MKIQSINSNNSFKGLYTNRTHQNNYNWLMEYQPYSWEMKNETEFGAAPQTELDIFAKQLPDNEKIFTPAKERKVDSYYYSSAKEKFGREFCKDILGTEFYYTDYDMKTKRTDISKIDALNRENSLKVLANKLAHFEELKMQKIEQLAKEIEEQKSQYFFENMEFSSHSNNYEDAYWKSDKAVHKRRMDNSHEKGKKNVSNIIKAYDDIISLNKSIEDVKSQKAECLKEAGLLEDARQQGKLIDISVRTKYDPNRILWEELQKGADKISAKLVSLPHKTVAMKDILKNIGTAMSTDNIAIKVIEAVDKMIKAKI